MDAIHQEEYKGFTLEIHTDDHPMQPEGEYDEDCLAFVYSEHDDFYMPAPNPKDFDRTLWYQFPLYVYSHSGVAVSLSNEVYPFNCQWDSCQAGFVFVKRSETPTKEEAYKIADSILDTWNMYLRGDVLGYVITDDDGETIDSCWGFYDSQEAVLEEARSVVNAHLHRMGGEQLELLSVS